MTGTAHLDTKPAGLAPGFYPSMPQGHCQLVGSDRSLVVCDMTGAITIGGIEVTDPAVLRSFAAHLGMLADRLAGRAGNQPGHLWLCGCLINDAGAHRVGCPEYPQGRRGER